MPCWKKSKSRDRAIFPRLTANEVEKRVTYDQIDQECDLDLRKEGWQWDKKRQLVSNGKKGKVKKHTSGIIVNRSKIR